MDIFCSFFYEYQTTKVITFKNVSLRLLQLTLQSLVVAFVLVYQLWYAQGYQEFAIKEASVTTKVKGYSM